MSLQSLTSLSHERRRKPYKLIIFSFLRLLIFFLNWQDSYWLVKQQNQHIRPRWMKGGMVLAWGLHPQHTICLKLWRWILDPQSIEEPNWVKNQESIFSTTFGFCKGLRNLGVWITAGSSALHGRPICVSAVSIGAQVVPKARLQLSAPPSVLVYEV